MSPHLIWFSLVLIFDDDEQGVSAWEIPLYWSWSYMMTNFLLRSLHRNRWHLDEKSVDHRARSSAIKGLRQAWFVCRARLWTTAPFVCRVMMGRHYLVILLTFCFCMLLFSRGTNDAEFRAESSPHSRNRNCQTSSRLIKYSNTTLVSHF